MPPALMVPFLILLASVGMSGADKMAELQEHFDRETHANGKIKALDKLAPVQFEATAKASQVEDYSTAALIFEKYRDNVRVTFELLRKQEPDADRHPDGYRHLELQVRRGIHEVEDAMATAPVVVQPPLQIVREDLIAIDDELIHLLFPRRTRDPQKVPTAPGSKP